jgi:hypothetical protein
VRHLETVLPPSFETHSSHHGTAKIEYILEVKAKRPGRLQRDIATRHQLIFLPLDPPLSLIMAGSGFCMTSGPLYINTIRCEGKLATAAGPSPGQIPILLLYATLPSPAVLYSEETVPLRLILRRLPILTEDLYPIQLCSLAIRLQSMITITLGPPTHVVDVIPQSFMSNRAQNRGGQCSGDRRGVGYFSPSKHCYSEGRAQFYCLYCTGRLLARGDCRIHIWA